MTAHRAPEDAKPDSVGTLATLAEALIWVSILLAVASLIGGVAIAQISRSTAVLFGQPAATSYPYLWAGIAAGAGGLVSALVLGLVATWAKAWAETR